jgi:hypothetical protein
MVPSKVRNILEGKALSTMDIFSFPSNTKANENMIAKMPILISLLYPITMAATRNIRDNPATFIIFLLLFFVHPKTHPQADLLANYKYTTSSFIDAGTRHPVFSTQTIK